MEVKNFFDKYYRRCLNCSHFVGTGRYCDY
jgi:hypothetical protein